MTSKTTLDRWWDRILDDEPQLRHPNPDHVAAVFASRGIAEDVWRARPYVPYGASDWDAVLAADPSIAEMSPGRRAYLHKLVNQRPGLVMHRAGWEGRPPLVAQLRPFKFRELGFDVRATYGADDQGVLSSIEEHNHASPEWHYHDRSTAVVVDLKRRTKRKGAPDERFMPDHQEKAHGGNPPPDGEAHPHYPNRAAHIERQHDGVDVVGRHEHGRFAKYVYPPGEEAARIDVHADAWSLLEAGGEVVYFALEGLLKNDAILSTGAPVVNVGSVSLWQDRALGWLAETYLARFGTVAVVPDSDAGGNDDVMSQANGLAARLASFGVARVVVAVPTATCGRVCTHLTRSTGERDPWTGEPIMLPAEDHKRGVDDFVGAGESLLSMMVALPGEDAPPAPDIGTRWDAQRRNRDVIEHVQATAGFGGSGIYPSRGTGETIGVSRGAVVRAFGDAEEAGVVRRSDRVEERDLMRERGAAGEPATRVTLAPEWRPRPGSYLTLGELLRG
jgi:hypothetical protein